MVSGQGGSEMRLRRGGGAGMGELVREECAGDEGVDMIWMERMVNGIVDKLILYVE
jgi:hypothetical protein